MPIRTQGNIEQKFDLILSYWDPHIIGELNGQHVKLAKLLGEFDWHHHENEDEMFLIVEGELYIDFEDKTEKYKEGDFVIIPRLVKHRPHCSSEAKVLLFEPNGTTNTGNVVSEKTKQTLKRI